MTTETVGNVFELCFGELLQHRMPELSIAFRETRYRNDDRNFVFMNSGRRQRAHASRAARAVSLAAFFLLGEAFLSMSTITSAGISRALASSA
jgi:hypothetical protein